MDQLKFDELKRLTISQDKNIFGLYNEIAELKERNKNLEKTINGYLLINHELSDKVKTLRTIKIVLSESLKTVESRRTELYHITVQYKEEIEYLKRQKKNDCTTRS